MTSPLALLTPEQKAELLRSRHNLSAKAQEEFRYAWEYWARLEQLPPTGPILGAFESARYSESVLPLETGDAFALYTDGLTEAGPSRRDFFGIDRLIALLRDDVVSAQALVDRLKGGVEAHTGGVYNDDICLLIGVVEEPRHRIDPFAVAEINAGRGGVTR